MVAKGPSVMEQLQVVEVVLKCANHVATLKCKCKLQCNSPHNNVGKCTTPTTAEDHDSSDDESDQKDNQNEES